MPELAPASFTPMQRFWRLLRPDRGDIRNIYVYAIFSGLVNLSLPLGIQAIVNFIQGGRISASWIVLVCIVVFGVAIVGVLQIFQLRIVENLQQKIFTRAAFEFAFRMPRIRMEALYRRYAPELMNRFFDTMSVQKGLSKILIDFISASLQVIFGMILLSLYHPFFIAFGFVLIALVFILFRLTAMRGLNTSLEESKHKYKIAHWLEELGRTSTSFRLAGRTDLPLKRTDGHVDDYLNARESHFKVLVQQYWFLVLFKVVVAAGLLAIGGILVMEQLMNIGQFVAAEIIILTIMNSVEKLTTTFETIYDVLTGLEKMGQVTDMPLETAEGVNLENMCNDVGLTIEMNDVGFTYPSEEKASLHNVSLYVECSERVVITGLNGSGRSTLLHLIAGLFEPQDGRQSYNGFPIGNLDLSSLRAVIGDCLAHERLFEGTVLENITMGRKNVTLEMVQRTVADLHLEDLIKNLPKGYETHLGPQGKNLPRSMEQRILLARSVVARPKLLLLEDALEHIDEADRKDIVDYLTAPENGWTLIAVSSDPYLMSKVDQVLYMEKGTIVSKMEKSTP